MTSQSSSKITHSGWRSLRRQLSLATILCGLPAIAAAQEFDPIFNDGAVLQCEMDANVWGKASPGTAVAVLLDDRKLAEATADGDGKWRAAIPMQPPGGPHTLEVRANFGAAKLSDVWFGEVWMATGQSNMVMTLHNTAGGKEALAKKLPEIRFVKVPQKTGLPVESTYTAADLKWNTFEPGPNNKIAAVAFFFAEKIQSELGRKVGIIQSSYGGTPAQAWTPMSALESEAELRHYAEAVRAAQKASKSKEEWLIDANALQEWQREKAAWEKNRQGPPPANPGPPDPGNPWSSKGATVLYENMIAPLVPYTTRGVVWYQGEGNTVNPQEYRKLFPAMIQAWRKVWNRPDWPFFFVQLASYDHPTTDWPGLRAAQAFTRDTVPHTGMAVAIDVGERKDIHPRAKQPVGERLALLALDQVYGKEVVSRSPRLEKLEPKDGRIAVSFQYAEDGLQTSDGTEAMSGFEVAGTDEIFHPAEAKIVSKSVVEVKSDAVKTPSLIRYAWQNWIEPPVTLQNSAGLPAEPFLQSIGGEHP